MVTVKVYGTLYSPLDGIEDTIGKAYARHDQPVQVTVQRGAWARTLNLSFAEALALYDALSAARKGAA